MPSAGPSRSACSRRPSPSPRLSLAADPDAAVALSRRRRLAQGPARTGRRPRRRALPPADLRLRARARRLRDGLGALDRRPSISAPRCGRPCMKGCWSKAAATPWRQASSSSAASEDALSHSCSSVSRGPWRSRDRSRHLAIDGALSAGGANLALMDLLDRAGPYGPGHPEPRFVFPAHRLSRVRADQGGCISAARYRPLTARASRLAPSASPTRRSASCCCKGRGCRCTSRAICAARAGRAARASS